MTDPRALLDDYGQGYELVANGRLAGQVQRDVIAPKAFAALRAVLELHKPIPAGTTCADDMNCSVCLHEGDIANEHPDNWYPQRWPCGTVQAITTALETK